ncbi:purine-nucleoside phosphorylase [Haloplasma contractile]|uniref:Purine nucleoside phosphorylase n=1 Tax=Haloplasma contractile SSD-17B TaxID=1033810 RepID=F7PUB3_9MOLU|nr:purine-nucleoside phosphorylase [Haloplasma contractile]ERJ11701.1 purine-nucleoside phosphorylase protein [Haloplasma contractile SSD-17B]
MHKIEAINQTKEFLQSKISGAKPTLGLILGSGLGELANEIQNAIVIPYSDIPNFASSEAVGHANELVIGDLNEKTVIAMKGRFHYYEGYSLDQVTFPVRVMKALGVEKLIITNSCGAVNESFEPGDLMLITDHLNLVSTNPLIGKNDDDLGPRFIDLSTVYNKDMRNLARDVANGQELTLREGVYTWWSGPAYETPAEIRMIRTLGGDAVGMSTVPEAIVATHAGIKVLGISCLTNMAAGILDQPLTHEEVIITAGNVRSKFISLVKGIIDSID